MFKRRNPLKGLTLLELMLALAISFLIFDALLTIYLSAQKNQSMQAALNSIQENAEIAAQFLRQDIQQAGYRGCARLREGFPVADTLTVTNRIFGTNNSVTVRHASAQSGILLENMSDNSIINTASAFKAGEVVLISNCSNAEIFKIKKVSGVNNQKIFSETPLTQRYDKNSEISNFEINTYFIAATDRKTIDGKTVMALYRQNINNRKTELVEGIDNMQITYDIDQSGEVLTVQADQVSDWSKVLGVRIAMHVSALNLSKTWFIYAAL